MDRGKGVWGVTRRGAGSVVAGQVRCLDVSGGLTRHGEEDWI